MAPLGNENIGRFDVAMNDALRMSGIEAIGDFDAEIEKNLHVQRTAHDQVLQGPAIKIFHGDKGFAGFVADVVNRANARVVQRGCGLRFALESREDLRVACDVIG